MFLNCICEGGKVAIIWNCLVAYMSKRPLDALPVTHTSSFSVILGGFFSRNLPFALFFFFVLAEIINKVREPPPLCRPELSLDESPLDVIQIVKQAWSEEPERRPTFEDIFKQVGGCERQTFVQSRFSTSQSPFCSVTVQEHQQGKEDKYH